MTKIVLDSTNSGYNLSKINSNFDKIEDFLNDEVLSRSNPTSDANEMDVTLDMNGQRIINLPTPVSLNEPARMQDLLDATLGTLSIIPASFITNTPGHGIVSTDVQTALYELSDEAAVAATALSAETTARANADTTLTNNIATNTTSITNINTDLSGIHTALITTGLYVTNVATLKTVAKTSNHNVATLGYYAANDNGHGVYWYDSTDTTSTDNGGTIIVANDGGRWKLLHNGEVSVRQFGAKGIGTGFNDTSAFQQSIATGLRVLINKSTTFFYLTDAVTCSTKGQQIHGQGKDVSIIQIDTGFNMSAIGLFYVASGEEGPQFSEFQVNYVQPDTTARGSLTTYPPTFYNQGSPRATIENVKVTKASNIYDMRNNAGGLNFTGCEFSWFNIAVNIDGSVDSVKFDRCHFWPFGLTANQQTIFYDANCIGINTARCDDLHIDNCLFINGVQLNCYLSGLGSTFGNVVNTDFDTNSGIRMSAGSLQLAGCYFSNGISASNQAIVMTGGQIVATSCQFAIGLALSNAQCSIQGGNAVFILSNATFNTGSTDMSSIACAAATTIMVSNCLFVRGANISPTRATIAVLGGRATIIGNRTTDKGTGTGAFVSVSTDDKHMITGNAFMGWTPIYPASPTLMYSVGNIN